MAWTPVLKIGQVWREATHPAYQLDLTGEDFLRLAKVAPGELSNLVLNPLSKDTQFVDDPLAGQIPFRSREISPTYTPRWISTGTSGAMAWLQIPQPEEAEQRRVSRVGVLIDAQKLADKAEQTLKLIRDKAYQLGKKPSAGNKQQWEIVLQKLKPREREVMAGLVLLLEELDERGTGFLEEVPNLYDSGATGIRWNFAVPNVEKILLSSWGVQADQTQIFRFKRLFNLPGQVKPEFGIYIGNGRTQYAIVFSQDEAVEFRHYTNIAPSERARLERDLAEVNRSGHLTASNLAQIALWQAQIDKIKKDAGATGSKLDGSNASAVHAIKQQVSALRASKAGLTDAAQAHLRDIKKKLYIQTVPIGLQEDARSLSNQEVTVALRFHRKGFVSVRLGLGASPGKEAFYYEIESITKTARPHRILPADSHIMLKSNGGPFGLIYGVADFASKATLATQPFEIEWEFKPEEWSFTLDAIGLRDEDADGIEGDAGFNSRLATLPRCRIESRVEQISGASIDSTGAITRPARIRAVLDFLSEPRPISENPNAPDPLAGNHDFGAELYRARLTCVAGEAPDASEIVWDSRQHPIEDVQLSSNGAGASMHEVFVNDSTRAPSDLPTNLANRYCEFGLIDTRTPARTYVPLVRGGVISEPARENLRFFTKNGGLQIGTREGSSAHLMVLGLEARLDRRIEVPLVGNNERPNEYLRKLALSHGIGAQWLQGIAIGPLSGMARLEPPAVGKPPDIKPNVGDSLWIYMKEVVAKHCPMWRLRIDAILGVVLERVAWRDRRDLHFRTDVPYHHPLSIHREPGGGSGLRLTQDLSEYWTETTFTGAYNPGQGKRYSATHRIWEATARPGSAYYVGERLIYRAAVDESLRSKWRCEMAQRGFLLWHGLPPYLAEWTSWYRPDLWEGDMILVDGLAVVVRRLVYTRFARALEQKVAITARLAQDVTAI